MKVPVPLAIYYLAGVAFFLLSLGIQMLVYRNLKAIFRAYPRLLLMILIAVNGPQLAVYLAFFLRELGTLPFLVKGIASIWQVLSVLFLLYVALVKGVYRLSFLVKHRKNDAPISANESQFRLSRRRFLKRAVAGFSGMAAWGTFTGVSLARGLPVIESVDLRHPDLPLAFDGMRVVQLSDFHAGPYMSRDDLLRIREMAERLNPDVLVLTGDFADSHPDQVPMIAEALQEMSGKLATFAIPGNHDYLAGIEHVKKGLQEAQLPLLVNEHRLLTLSGEHMAVIGLDDRWAVRWGKDGPNFQAALEGIPKNAFKLCLSHQPQLWPACLAHGIHITLSGHTHGGQIGVPYTQLSLARLVSPFVAGLYRHGPNKLYVNRGLGTVGLPVRIGVPPEITVIRLLRGE